MWNLMLLNKYQHISTHEFFIESVCDAVIVTRFS